MHEHGGSQALSYRESLGRSSPFYLVLDMFVLAVLAFYRARVHVLLDGIFPASFAGEQYRSYMAAAFASDVMATTIVLAVLVAGWLLTPVFKRILPLLSLLFVVSYSAFMVFATDFIRVYQTAFGKNYIGGEQFTDIKSMLVSAVTEISTVSRSGLVIFLLLLISSSIFTLGKRMRARERSIYRIKRFVAFFTSLVLVLALFSVAMTNGNAEGLHASPARTQGAELGTNPVSALLFGPGRETFMPPAAERVSASDHATDSIEKPGTDRFLPVVKKGNYNVILYLFESTSWSYYDLEYNGEQVLPAMHSLSRNGLLLSNHYSNYPLSANTIYSVMSSRYSMYGKSMIFREYHDVDVHTITEVLSDNGYATCLIHTGDLLYAERNKFLANRGIDEFILYKDLMVSGEYGKNVGWGADERLMIKPAVDWIKRQSSPYFLIMAPVNPHHPYATPDDFRKITDPEEMGIGTAEKTWRNYLNSLHYADAAMGNLIDELENENLMENTVFVMVTDHGEAFYQHTGNYNHPLFIYEENVHVPAIFYSKSLFPFGIVMDSISRHIDIMPSILDLLEIGDVTARDGESIFSASREKMAVFHTSWNDELMGVRDGNWKYIKRMKDSREELYDLEKDPGEKNNIAVQHPSILERYRKVSDDMVSYMVEQYRNIARKK